MKPTLADKDKYYLNLEKCSEEERKHVFSLLPEEEDEQQYKITGVFKYLYYDKIGEYWFVDSLTSFNKTELTYSEFVGMFEGGEGENNAEMISLHEVRELFANYRFSEGCSCCRNIDDYEEYSNKIGELLKVEKYIDDSGYDFSKYRTS